LEAQIDATKQRPPTPTGHLTGVLVKAGYAKLPHRAAAKIWGCCRPCQATRRGSGASTGREKSRAADFFGGSGAPLGRIHLPPSLSPSFFMPLPRYLALISGSRYDSEAQTSHPRRFKRPRMKHADCARATKPAVFPVDLQEETPIFWLFRQWLRCGVV